MDPRKILIRGPNWVGDAVLAIPAIRALRDRFPRADITLLVRPWVAGLFTSFAPINRVWTERQPVSFRGWSRLTRKMRAERFDLAVLLPNSFESALMVFLGRIPKRVGYATDGRRLLLTQAVKPRRDARHQVYYYLDLVESVAAAAASPSIEIQATAGARHDARELFIEEGLDPNRPYLVVNPGAAYGSAKRWDERRFAETADWLVDAFDVQVVVVGSQAERTVGEAVRQHMRAPAAVLSGKTTLETLIGVLSGASLVITNDSGPMHIAAALGTPTVAIFGSTDERATGPIGNRTRIVKHPVDCSPCLLRECPIDHRCMTRVNVEDVIKAAEEIWAK